MPVGDSLGWFGSKTYDGGWNDGNYWTLVGYPGAIANAEQPSWQGGISFHDDDEDGDAMELETNNGDSSPGDSGGPLFAWWADGSPYVVGEVSGQEEESTYHLEVKLPPDLFIWFAPGVLKRKYDVRPGVTCEADIPLYPKNDPFGR